jgi:hypothetical protein
MPLRLNRGMRSRAQAAMLILCALAVSTFARASSTTAPQPAETPPQATLRSADHRVWVSPGFLTWHASEPANRTLEGRNPGIGLDWQWSAEQRLSIGRFRNSDREPSRYGALYHQPLVYGPWRIGLALGVMDGYPNYRQGRPFPAILPVASWEQLQWAVDWAFIPTISDRLYGGVSFRLRLRLH